MTVPAKSIKPDQMVIPLWQTHQRGVPNVLARSALFSVGTNNKKRANFEASPVASYGENGKVTYTGIELRQDDADLFLQLIHLQRNCGFNEGVAFQSTPMLKILGRSLNTNYTERMKRSLQRMVATAVTIEITNPKDGNTGYCGSLIQRFAWKDDNGLPMRQWRVWFDPKIAQLFDWASYSRLDWEVRLSLSPLAKWLHLFYSSHQAPHALKYETLMHLCGSSMAVPRQFKVELMQAADQLKNAGFLEQWNIDQSRGTFHVTKTKKIK